MTLPRRTFLHRGAAAGTALAAALPAGWARPETLPIRGGSPHPQQDGHSPQAPALTTLYDPLVKALAMDALDAARRGGASYADVRLTRTILSAGTTYKFNIGMSARALVNGYWGWAATPYLSASEAPRIGREAAHLATLGATRGAPRTVELGTLPVVPDGHWQTPIRIDPFTVPLEEIADLCGGWMSFADNLSAARGLGSGTSCGFKFDKQERVFASTEGSYLTQTVSVIELVMGLPDGRGFALPLAQAGWEYVLDANMPERIRAALDQVVPRLPTRSHLEIGRYDVLFTAPTVARLLNKTLAPATALDLALGYEANEEGTSYLGPDPLHWLGAEVASPLITLLADRSDPQGLMTARWDDDGVPTMDFPIIRQGVLVDYQSTREQAAWLAPWYQRQDQEGQPVRSRGGAATEHALCYPMQLTPNLTLTPGPVAGGVAELAARMERGLIVDNNLLQMEMDFQCATGVCNIGSSRSYEVRHGRVVAQYAPSDRHLMFRTPELWTNILAIGGADSVQRQLISQYFGEVQKGQVMEDFTRNSVAAVPIVVKQLAVI